MSVWTSRGWKSLACLAVLLIAWRLPAAAQEARAREDVLQALLTEVQGLRVALEQIAAAGPRAQLVVGRLQIQEQRLNVERRRLDGVRESIASAEREAAELRDRMAMMEDAVPRADPAVRDDMAAQLRMGKAALTQKTADIQRLREQEAELTGSVATEESRWTEISQRLDELERSLAPRR